MEWYVQAEGEGTNGGKVAPAVGQGPGREASSWQPCSQHGAEQAQGIVCFPCPALPCPALPCPALPCPVLPCPALFLPCWLAFFVP